MRTIEEIVKGLDCCRAACAGDEDGCPYYGEDADQCANMAHDDAITLIRQLRDENRALRSGADPSSGAPWGKYWQNICDLNAKQEAKGLRKYGQPLEENTTLTTAKRIEHAQEEAVDLLKYLEHLKQVAVDGITADDYQRAAMRTANGMDYHWAPDRKMGMLINGVMGLNGEAGEVVDLLKKHLFQGHDLDRDALIIECGDCIWYAALIASALDVPFSQVLLRNIEKLKRRYPEGFSEERSINREEAKTHGDEQ